MPSTKAPPSPTDTHIEKAFATRIQNDTRRILAIFVIVFLYGMLAGLHIERQRLQEAYQQLRIAQVLLQTPQTQEAPPETTPAAPIDPAPPLVPEAEPEVAPVSRYVPLPAWELTTISNAPQGRLFEVVMTAYASLPEQTCGTWCTSPDDPFITATGNWVRPGTLAVSRDLLGTSLPYGSRVRIVEIKPSPGCNAWLPSQQGVLPEVLLVDDTMHPRKHQQIDVWMPNNTLALRWGRCSGVIELL